jgi:hypothetical protein
MHQTSAKPQRLFIALPAGTASNDQPYMLVLQHSPQLFAAPPFLRS